MISDGHEKRKPVGSRAILSIACLSGLIGVTFVFLGILPVGISGEWEWAQSPAHRWDEVAHAIVAFILLMAVVLVSLGRVSKSPVSHRAILIAMLVAFSFALQIGVAKISPAGLCEFPFAVSVPRANSYFHRASDISSLRDYLSSYVDEVRQEPFRVQLSTHPAGPVVFFYGIQEVYSASSFLTNVTLRISDVVLPSDPEIEAIFRSRLLPQVRELKAAALASAYLLILCAALAVVPVYAAASRLFSRDTGLLAAAFAALVPSMHLFSPSLDQLLVLLGAIVFWLVALTWRKRFAWLGCITGVFAVVALQFSLSLGVVMAVAVLAMTLAELQMDRGQRYWPVVPILCGLCGAAVMCVVAFVVFDYDVVGTWIACLQGNARFNQISTRSYGVWISVNPIEWAVFLGLPLTVLSIPWQKVGRSGTVAVSLCVILLLLNISGANRGEVARLWMPLMPIAAMSCANVMSSMKNRRRWIASVLCFQFMQVIALKVSLDVLSLYQGI